jgi:A/G-specific adenine glycosylase
MKRFSTRVVAWQRRHGRRGLPWQDCRDAYRVWLSEIMLQQTQVATVLPYYTRFLERFPDVHALAAAPLDAVLQLWAGLGYYTRARNLHACARKVASDYGGAFPSTADELARLPGIGRSTAAAIAAFCFDERTPILDGNVKRVLARHFAVEGDPSRPLVEQAFWQLAASLLPPRVSMAAYTQGLMDLGATICTRTSPACARCPLHESCIARRDSRIAELPGARRARALPLRRVHWLLPVGPDAVLLERRAPAGLWGGLLAPLEFDSARALATYAQSLGARLRAPLAPRRHAFSHYKLEFIVHAASLERPTLAAEDRLEAIPWASADAVAVPTPVRTLLRELRATLASPPGDPPARVADAAPAPIGRAASRPTSARRAGAGSR